ncbi:MAG: hypothetical protein ACRCYU_16410, partial [Nocardioides sp.]
DGNRIRLTIRRSEFIGNAAREAGSAIFFVSNDRTGTMTLSRSALAGNVSEGFDTPGLPGIFFLGGQPPRIVNGTTVR